MTGPDAPASFRLAYVPGATPAKWVRTWGERVPEVPLTVVPVAAGLPLCSGMTSQVVDPTSITSAVPAVAYRPANRVRACQLEAAAKFGDDPRVYLTTATKFEGDANGQVKAVHTVQVRWEKNEKGQFIPKDVPGTEKVVPAQLVLLAMGFLGPEQHVLEQLAVEPDARSNAKAPTYATSAEGVFAAGDARRGQSLIVWAINEGRQCARMVDRYLSGLETPLKRSADADEGPAGPPQHIGPRLDQFLAGDHFGNHQTRAMAMGDLPEWHIANA